MQSDVAFHDMDGAGQTSKPCCFDFIIESEDEERCTETNMAETLCATDSRDISTPRHRSVGSQEEGRFVVDPRTLSRGPLSLLKELFLLKCFLSNNSAIME